MKAIEKKTASALLLPLGLKIGAWNQITSIETLPVSQDSYTQLQASRDVNDLFAMSAHLSAWAPLGKWIILQMDNSSSFDAAGASFFESVLKPSAVPLLVNDLSERTYFQALSSDPNEVVSARIHLTQLIFWILLMRQHGQVVSSESNHGEYLNLQDGFVYFMHGKSNARVGTESILRMQLENPLQYPEWITQLIEKGQAL